MARIDETPYDRALAEISGRELRLSQEILRPIEDYIIGEVGDVAGREREALGIANVEAQTQFGENADRLDAIAGRRGVGLGSSAGIGLLSDYAQDRGQSVGLGQVDANQSVQDTYFSNLDSLAAYGQGLQADGIEGLGASSRLAGQQARFDVEQSIRDKQGAASAIGGAAGIGYGLYRNAKGGSEFQAPTFDFDIDSSFSDAASDAWDGRYGRVYDFRSAGEGGS